MHSLTNASLPAINASWSKLSSLQRKVVITLSAQSRKDEMIVSILWLKKGASDKGPGILVMNITSQKWKEELEKRSFVTIVRIRGKDEYTRPIREFLLKEPLNLLNVREITEPHLVLNLPIELSNDYNVDIFLLQNGESIIETFSIHR